MKCPNPACDYSPEPTDWCCEVCGTRLPQDAGADTPVAGAQVSATPVAAAVASTLPASSSAAAGARVCKCGGTQFDASDYCEDCGKKYEARAEVRLIEIGPQLASASDVGMKHPVNQDAALVSQLPNGDYFLAVSDGVSTAEKSEVASELAVSTLLRVVSGLPDANPAEALMQGMKAADAAVKAMPYNPDSGLAEPQATIVCAIVRGRQAWIGWVGDSRAYELGTRNKGLTVDDSWYVQAIAGGMSRAEALSDRRAHAITQCLGMRDDTAIPHVTSGLLEDGASLLLCSDGLWNYYEDAPALHGLMLDGKTDDSALTIARRFVDRANRAGGRDNISVAFLRAA